MIACTGMKWSLPTKLPPIHTNIRYQDQTRLWRHCTDQVYSYCRDRKIEILELTIDLKVVFYRVQLPVH